MLVYPCGTEIGLEIYKAACRSTHFELIGGSSSYDHGRFVYQNHIDNLPFICDFSREDDIKSFVDCVKSYKIDYVYPAMDGVLSKFAEYRELIPFTLIAPNSLAACLTRSKKLTYNALKNVVPVPQVYDANDPDLVFPLFLKPDVGQGSVGACKVENKSQLDCLLSMSKGREMLLMDYLPGEEITVDCFTGNNGNLVYSGARRRKRIKAGISVNSVSVNDSRITLMAQAINQVIPQRGGWFFQVKTDENEQFVLMEVSSRIAGTSAFTRCLGVNLPLMTMHLFNGCDIESVLFNDYSIEIDRAFENSYKINLSYSHLYVDYDDTLVVNGCVNLQLVALIYQCINNRIPVTLLTRHNGALHDDLLEKRLVGLFDDIIHLQSGENKAAYITESDAIFIDDSYGERYLVHKELGIFVFDAHMVECLIHS